MNKLDPYRLPKEYDFCKRCGHTIIKGKKYCDDDCKKGFIRSKRPKSKRLYADNLWTRCK